MTTPDKFLLKLQKIDSALDNLKHDLENIPERPELDHTETCLREIGVTLAKTREEVTSLEHTRKEREDATARLQAKIAAEEKKLYAGKIGNPKELMSLQQEIRVLESDKDELETEYLVGLDALTEAQEHEQGLAVEEANHTHQAANLKSALISSQARLLHEIEIKEEERETTLKQLDKSVLNEYEMLRARNGLAVVTAPEGICGGCYMENSEDSEHNINEKKTRRCEYCHRIIVST